MENLFGIRVKELRESRKLLQREVASNLQIDTPMLSKIERGERKARREYILLFAKLLSADIEELTTLWLADQVYSVIKNEKMADKALQSVSVLIKSNNK